MPGSQLGGSWNSPGLTTEVLSVSLSFSVCLSVFPKAHQALPSLTQYSQSEGALTLGSSSSGFLHGQAPPPCTVRSLDASRLAVPPEPA